MDEDGRDEDGRERDGRERDGRERDGAGGTNRLEAVLGACGGALVLALLAYLGHQALTQDSGPRLHVQVVDTRSAPGGHAVELVVRNTGGRTARDVELSGELTRDGRLVSEATVTLPYVPPDSHRGATLVLSEDPATGRLQVRASGFTTP